VCPCLIKQLVALKTSWGCTGLWSRWTSEIPVCQLHDIELNRSSDQLSAVRCHDTLVVGLGHHAARNRSSLGKPHGEAITIETHQSAIFKECSDPGMPLQEVSDDLFPVQTLNR
jgi:hypothetical protein